MTVKPFVVLTDAGDGYPVRTNDPTPPMDVTVMDWLPVTEAVTVSVAVMLCVPAVLSVAPFVNVCVPVSPPTNE